MNKSQEINELALALSKLQGEINDVGKNKQGYGYTYADLGSVLEIARPLLAKHGLSVTQLPQSAGEKVSVETLLMHSSGQWISSTIEMQVERGKNMSLAQAVGSVITYARRYSLAAILGIAQVDDDAALEQPKPEKPKPYTSEPIKPKVEVAGVINGPNQRILSLLKETSTNISDVLTHYKVPALTKLKKPQEEDLISMLERKAQKLYQEVKQ